MSEASASSSIVRAIRIFSGRCRQGRSCCTEQRKHLYHPLFEVINLESARTHSFFVPFCLFLVGAGSPLPLGVGQRGSRSPWSSKRDEGKMVRFTTEWLAITLSKASPEAALCLSVLETMLPIKHRCSRSPPSTAQGVVHSTGELRWNAGCDKGSAGRNAERRNT